jgi:uncharacterized membrane protein
MEKMIFAAFSDHGHADSAVHELHSLGYSPQDISIITKENRETEGSKIGEHTASGAVSGAATGGVIGGIAGLLAGAGIFPALAGILIGGPLAVALGLTGMAASTLSGVFTGALAGGLIGALTGIGVSNDDAHYYNETVTKGGVLIAVPLNDNDESSVQSILSEYGAQQVRVVAMPERAKEQAAVGTEERSRGFAMRQPVAAHQKMDETMHVSRTFPEDVEGESSDIVRF